MDRPRTPESFRTTPEGAVVQAHLDELHAPVDAGLDRLLHDAVEADGACTAVRGRRVGGVRVRLGRGLVALGAAVAGEDQRRQGTNGQAA
jgi:hypothetical protein